MRLNSEDLRELYQQETSRSARGSAGGCLTEETLTRAAAGELSQSERERTADHVVICSDCAREYRAIRSLKPWVDEVSANAGAQVIPLPVSENGQHHAGGPTLREAQIGSRRVSFYLPYAIAAAALILSLALGALLISKSRENQRLVAEVNNRQATQNAEDRKTAEALAESRRLLEETNQRVEQESAARRVAEEELARRNAAERSSAPAKQNSASAQRLAPDVNVPIIDLNPYDAGRGEQNRKPAAIQLPADTDLFTLILNLGGEDASSSYSLEVTDRNSRTIWVSRNLRKSPYNNFTVAMRRSSFPAGDYRLKIYGLRNGRRELVEEYAIRLAY
jgi:hypothetical protein